MQAPPKFVVFLFLLFGAAGALAGAYYLVSVRKAAASSPGIVEEKGVVANGTALKSTGSDPSKITIREIGHETRDGTHREVK